jgi:hypothetical protein
MNDKNTQVERLCQSALERVDLAIRNHEQHIPDDLSIPMLNKIRQELLQMKVTVSSTSFCPSYSGFILDWPDEHGLVKQLSEVAYEYERLN